MVLETELIAGGESDFATFELGQIEPSDMLLVQTFIPADDETVLGLGFFETLVIIGFNLDERAKDVLVLIGIFVSAKEGASEDGSQVVIVHDVPQKNRLGLVVGTRFLKVLESGFGIVLPKLFELVDLSPSDLSGSRLLGVVGYLDKPRKELPVFDEGAPLGSVPDEILG